MRKKLLIALVVVAAGIWLWNMRLLFVGLGPSAVGEGGMTRRKATQSQGALRVPRTVAFEERGKSPFVAYAQAPKPKRVTPKPRIAKAKPEKNVTLPSITITGIMWNDANPLAMVQLPGGASTVAKAGQVLEGGIAVRSIEKTRVEFEVEGRRFWIVK